MERRISHRRAGPAGAAAVLLVLVLAANARTEPVTPSLAELSANVLRAMVPPAGYQVEVTQTVEPAVLRDAVAAAASPAVTSRFLLNFSTTRGLMTGGQPLTLQPATEAEAPAPEAQAAQAPPGVRLRFDVKRVLSELTAMDNVAIAAETLDERPHWKVAGMSGDGSHGLAYALWVDAGTWTVSTFSVRLEKQAFSESQFSYRSSGGLWLPSRSMHVFPTDGTRVIQEFGAYLLQQEPAVPQ